MGCAPSQIPLGNGNGLPPSLSEVGSNSVEDEGSANGDSITDFLANVKTAEPVPVETINTIRKPRSNSIVDFLSRQKRTVSECKSTKKLFVVHRSGIMVYRHFQVKFRNTSEFQI